MARYTDKKNNARQRAAAQAAPLQKKGAGDNPLSEMIHAGPLVQRQQGLQQRVNQGIIQKKSLAQTGWVGGLSADGTRNLVTDGREVNLYSPADAAEQGSRAAAMQKAAEMNAAIGKTVDDEAQSKWGKDSNAKWTAKGSTLADNGANTVDPFYVGVRVPFTHATKKHSMEFTFQHAKDWTGYVESIYDTSNDATGAAPTMFDISTEAAGPAGQENGHYRNKTYSNVHEGDDNSNTFGMTTGDEEKNMDAYTKLVGEGARWQCIRNNITKVQNDSLIYTDTPGVATKDRADGRRTKTYSAPGIRFKDLWKTWSGEFGKAYDITDATVKTKLQRKQGWFQGKYKFELKDVTAAASKDIKL